jgi:hypothetical protein
MSVVVNYRAVKRSFRMLGTAIGTALIGFIQAGTGAVLRTLESKLRDSVSVKDFGATGDGVTDDYAAIALAIASGAGRVFFPRGNYRVTQKITITTNGPRLFGVNGRYNNTYVSRITVDHAGTGIHFENQSGLGASLAGIVVDRGAGYAGQGTNVAVDSNNGSGPSTITSHVDVRDCYILGGATGLLLRGLIFGRIGKVTIQGATTGLSMPGTGTGYVGNNNITIHDLSLQACTTGWSMAADCGNGILCHTIDIESCTNTIVIASGCTINLLKIDMLWLEDNTNAMKLGDGEHIEIGFIRHNNSSGIPLIDSATFGARYVDIRKVLGSATDFYIGVAGVNVHEVEIIADGGWAMTRHSRGGSSAMGMNLDAVYSADVIAGTSTKDVFFQSGRLGKNYLGSWDIATGGFGWTITGATNLATETGPRGVADAYSWTGLVAGACNAMPALAVGSKREMGVWVTGSGRVKMQNWGRIYHYNVDTSVWVWLPFRVVIENTGTQAMDAMNITSTPTSTGSLKFWNPGVYDTFDSIDTRPGLANGIYEGGYIDLTTYVSGAREGAFMVVHGTQPPAAGTWMVGDRVRDTTPTAGANTGWICTVTGAPGTWERYGSINLSGSATFDPANLADGAGETTTVTVTGAALGDYATASFSLDLQGITLTAWVSAANTVSVRLQNESGGALDLASGTLRAKVTKQ